MKGLGLGPAQGSSSNKDMLIRAEGSYLGDILSAMFMSAGDFAGAESALQAAMASEALSSTSSTGAEWLADLYMRLYMLAVEKAAEPDYKKGLTHLTEWLKL